MKVLVTFFFCAAAWLGAAHAAAREANLIATPSFEDGEVGRPPPRWEIYENGDGAKKLVTAAGGHSGKQEVQFSKEAPMKWAYIAQYVSAPSVDGEAYRYSGWLKASAETDVYVGLDAATEDGKKSVESYKTIPVGPEWKRFEVLVSIKNGPFERFRVLAKVSQPGVTVSLADVELVKTPAIDNARQAESRLKDLRRLQEPTDEIVSRHITWAKPSAEKPLRVLFITYNDGLREITELRERFDLQTDVFATQMQTDFSIPAVFLRDHADQINRDDVLANFTLEKQEARLREKLSHDYDLIVVGNIRWDALPDWAHSAIFDKVRNGTGLVGYLLGGQDESLKAALNGKIEINPREAVSAFPYAGLPAYRGSPDFESFLEANVQFAQFGKGRIAWFRRRGPDGSGNGDGIRVPFKQMITPEVVDAFPRLHMVDYDYYLALVDHLMNWAAGRTPAVRVIEPAFGTQPVDREEAAPLRVELESDADRTVTIQWAIREFESGQVWKQESRSLALRKGRSEVDLPIAGLPAGTYFADVWVKDGDKTVDFGSLMVEVHSRNSISNLALDDDAFNKADPIRGTVTLDGAKAGQNLQIVQWDNYGRQVASKVVPIDEKTVQYPFTLDASKPVSVIQTVEARLLDGAAVLDVKRALFTYRDLYPSDDIRAIVTQWQEGDTYVDVTLAETYRKMGFDAWLTDAGRSIQSYEELRGTPYYRFVRPPVKMDAKNMHIGAGLLGNLYSIPSVYDGVDGEYDWYVLPKGEAAPSVRGMVRKPCLSNPGFRRKAAEFYTGIARDISRYAIPAYDLIDEGFFSNKDQDVCFSDYSIREFQAFVRDEYKTIQKLNEEYGTSYKDWDEVVPIPYEQAKKEGKIPVWIDHRRHMETVWADYFARARAAINQVAPGARVGYHSTDDPDHTQCPTIGGAENYYLLAKAMNLNAPYYFPMQFDCVRDFSEPGTMIGGGAFGGYVSIWRGGRNSLNQHWWLWNTLLRGANSLWVWHGRTEVESDGFFNTFATDFSPYEFLRPTLEEIRFAKRGIGKLLMSSQRADDGVAVLYSPSSMLFASFDPGMPARWESPAAVPFVLTEAGFQYRMMASPQLEAGMLRNGKFRVLYLPFDQALSPKEVEEILAFAKEGGTVLADLRPAVADAHGKPYPQGALDELFGVKQDTAKAQPIKACVVLSGKVGDVGGKLPTARLDGSLRVTTGNALGKTGETPAIVVNSYGKGKGVLFNLAFSDYMAGDLEYGPEFADEEKAGVARALIRGVLEPGGIHPAVDLDPYVPGMHVFRFSSGESQTLGLVWDAPPFLPGVLWTEETKHAILAAQSRTVTLRLPAPAHLYDMRTGAYLGLQRTLQRTLSPGTVDLLAALPYKVDNLNLKLSNPAIKQGEPIDYTISLSVPNPSLHVFRVEFTDPDGNVADYYSVNAEARGGMYRGSLTTSLNEKPGTWKITARDVQSGVAASATFQIKAK